MSEQPPDGEAGLAQARDLPLDAHIHTNLSPDSGVPIDAYASQAVERRIAEIAITDHVDFAPGTPAFEFVPFEVRERTVREAADRWGPRGVAIRFGAEITYDHRYEEAIRDHLARFAANGVTTPAPAILGSGEAVLETVRALAPGR